MKNIKNHLIIILTFIAISFTYFSPLLENKKLETHDIKTWKGMSKEVADFRKNADEEPLWTNSMFSGMPTYQISTKYKYNLIQYVDKLLKLGIPRPANLLFLYLLGFYILLLTLKIDYRLSAIGAIAFAFSSYFFIIIQAGHMTKAHAIGYLPMVVAGVLYTYRENMYLGSVLTSVAVALQIYCNHLQITYYLLLILVLLGIILFVKFYKENKLPDFFKRTLLLLLSALLASATSWGRLSNTLQYGHDSTRGKSELTSNIDNKTSGLDKDYATQWSYGIAETFTLLIPNFYGGSSQGELGKDSEMYKRIRTNPNATQLLKNLPLYWGDQPIVNGPTYAGAIIIFLFVLGLFFVKSEMRLWLLLATILSITLAWGKNFMPLTDLFLDYFPGYNKFRAVSMILVIAEFALPLLGFIALNRFLDRDIESVKSKESVLKYTFYITGGISLLFALIPSMFFDFVGMQDDILKQRGWPVDALQIDRANILSKDAWRSFLFISLAFSILLLFLKNKIKYNYVILVLGFLVITDMWVVNKRYLNNDQFKKARKIKAPYKPTSADQIIYKNEGFNFNNYPQYPHFRVFNQSVSTFNDASTSYFHKSIGGYHGAKLKRYQELIENHISKGNTSVINMLNTKYIINRQGNVQENSFASGNSWFVNNIEIVPNADIELNSLENFDPKQTVIVDERFKERLIDSIPNISGSINLIEYKPNYLKYISDNRNDGIAVFSEIYYDKGWNAYIDGKLTQYFRANYVLRGMYIPAGSHTVEFKFEPTTYKLGENISLASSIILLSLLIFISVKELKQ